jgi:hypothetical protein
MNRLPYPNSYPQLVSYGTSGSSEITSISLVRVVPVGAMMDCGRKAGTNGCGRVWSISLTRVAPAGTMVDYGHLDRTGPEHGSGGGIGRRFTQLPTEPGKLGLTCRDGALGGLTRLGLLLGVKNLTPLARGEPKQGRLKGKLYPTHSASLHYSQLRL